MKWINVVICMCFFFINLTNTEDDPPDKLYKRDFEWYHSQEQKKVI